MPRRYSRSTRRSRTGRVQRSGFGNSRRFNKGGSRRRARVSGVSRMSGAGRRNGGRQQTVKIVVEHRNPGDSALAQLHAMKSAPAPKRPKF